VGPVPGFIFQPGLIYYLIFFIPCWLLGVGCRVLVLTVVSICRRQLFIVGCQVSVVECGVLTDYRLSGVAVGGCCWFLAVGCHVLVVECYLQIVECRCRHGCCWLPGCRVLVVVCWLLIASVGCCSVSLVPTSG
jgi:hypothetical protein